MELKVMTWNIHGAAALLWDKPYEIKKEIVDKIFEQEADIAVMTELVISKGWDYFQERLESNHYIWFMTNETGKNGVIVCIKNQLVDMKKLKQEVYRGNAILSKIDDCNILQITLPLSQNKHLTVMGVRVETATGATSLLKAQYDDRRDVFDKVLLPKIEQSNKSNNLYIVCGDFNNARCLGDLTQKFNSKDYNGKAQCGYNLNIIKDAFDGMGFKMADMGENNNGIPTWQGYVPNDHIFVHGFEVMECKCVPASDLSDHDIVWAKLKY